ncbi:fused response regulator/phosphatase [Reinekea sp.]|jgi:CheY-like chemotaxis protein|uniref:ATP-binding SpoIIE family protein phosphatase n=1 Tax=Reinekea sp. TaxID=1970455 RepID=UPI002A7EF8CC|nr:fused response regulator/phosphatase [Reinekea sp.]
MTPSLRILIADDNESDRMILRSIVRKEGHEVILAANGEEAIQLFWEHRPDLILLDVIMPVLDGLSVAKQLRAKLAEDYVPIIFLTSLQDPESLAKCLDSGGDDFLSKPYNRVILKAKIKAFGRMRSMHEKLQGHNRQMLIEQQVAKTIFDNVAHAGCLELTNISHSLSPLSVFNGDTVLAERKPDGGMHLFLGDFTGHGLPAAIGAMPLAEIFYGMTAKGFAMEEVLREINSKLRGILPVGVFCCGCFVELDFYEKHAKIWLGGLPDIVCYRAESQSIETFRSTNLPLGVLEANKFQPDFIDMFMADGDELFIWSDGIIESRNEDEELFGEDRLLAIFRQASADTLFRSILSEVDRFVGEAGADDDLTLLSVKMVSMDVVGQPDLENRRGSLVGPQDWEFSYTLGPLTLRGFNPLPMVLNIMTEVEGLRGLSGQLYTLLAELYSNALEHGVLSLPSNLKASSDGFSAYYSEREKRLSELTDGQVEIRVKHRPEAAGGLLEVTICDSGHGFDHKEVLARDFPVDGYSGRGLPLINGICEDFYYNSKGNAVTALLRWPPAL